MRKLLLGLALMLSLTYAHQSGGQDIIWYEDFTAESNGSTSGTASGTVGGTWSTNGVSGFRVQTNAFQVNGSSGTGIWRSNKINISSYGYAVLSVNFLSIGLGFGNNDGFIAYYILDNSGVEIQFGDFRPGFLIDLESQASAIVSGHTLEIVIKGYDNSLLGSVQFDDVTVTGVTVLYSRKSGSWVDMTGGLNGTGTWSYQRSGSPACGCVPLNNMVAVIQNSHQVNIPVSQTAVGGSNVANLAPGAVDVEDGGTLTFNSNGVTLQIQRGLLRVRNGGTVNSSTAAITGETVSFAGQVGGAMLQIDPGGNFSVENVSIAASNTHYIMGGGNALLTGNLTMAASGASVVNNLSATLNIGNQINFPNGVTGASVTNNETITANQIFFTSTGNTVTNAGTLSLQSINQNSNNSDNNTVNNDGQLNLNATGTSINAATGDLRINNTGTLIQMGDFANLVNGCNFVNQASGVWHLRKVNNSVPNNYASVLDFDAVGNRVYYSGTGDQTVLAVTYHHLEMTSGGTKAQAAALTANGTLTVQTGTTLTGTAALTSGTAILNGTGIVQGSGAFTVVGDLEMNDNSQMLGNRAIDVNGNITIADAAILGGTGNINIAGNWNAVDANSFVAGTRTVTFDGAFNTSITNASGLETFYTLLLNKVAAGTSVTMNQDVTVTQLLDLDRGRLLLNGNTLRITNATATAVSTPATPNNSFVVSESTTPPYGKIERAIGSTGSYVFPFGQVSSGSYVHYTYNHASGSGVLSLATYGTPANNKPFPVGVMHMNNAAGVDQSNSIVNRFWLADVISGSLTGTQSLRWVSGENNSGGTSRTAWRWNAGWSSLAGSSTANPYLIASAALPSNGIWTVGLSAAALPVEWLDFSVRLDNSEALIQWTTATEKLNDYFTVQRSADGEAFEDLFEVDGKGTSDTKNTYKATDPDPLFGTSYYRIKQTDFDGTVFFTGLRKLEYQGPDLAVLQAYPSPNNGQSITIEVRGLHEQDGVMLQIFNSQGALLDMRWLKVKNRGHIKEEIVFSKSLPAGLYILRAGETSYLTRKFLVK